MSNVKSITPNNPADFTPELGNYKTLQPFRYWCQKVLPLVYDDSLSYYELLCKVVDYLNKAMEDVETLHDDVINLHKVYEELQSYVNDYFSTLDVQQEINNKLDEMVEDGTFETLFGGRVMLNNQHFSQVQNSDGVITELLKCCDSYANNNSLFYYGNIYTAVDLGVTVSEGVNAKGQMQIDCSSFVQLVIEGINFSHSRYNGNTDNVQSELYGYPYYITENSRKESALRYTYDFAEWCSKNGLGFYPAEDFSNLQAGDIVFQNQGDRNPDKFLEIDHCLIYIGRIGLSNNLMFYNVVQGEGETDIARVSILTLPYCQSVTKFVARVPLGNNSDDSHNIFRGITKTTLPMNEYTTIYHDQISKGEWYTIIIESDMRGGYFTITPYTGDTYSTPTQLYGGKKFIRVTQKAENDFNYVTIGANDGNANIYSVGVYKGFKSSYNNNYATIELTGSVTDNLDSMLSTVASKSNKLFLNTSDTPFESAVDIIKDGNNYSAINRQMEDKKRVQNLTADGLHTFVEDRDIRFGTVSLQASAVNTTVSADVSIEKFDSNDYAVVLTVNSTYPNGYACGVSNRTENSFTINVYAPNTEQFSVNYIAFKL